MADTPDTPDTPTTDGPAPTPRRRAAPRKAAATGAAKPRGRKAIVAQVDDAAAKAASTVKATADKAAKAVKARSTSRGAPRATTRAAAATTRPAPAKRAAAGATKRSTARKSSDAKSAFDKATAKVGGKWGAASIIGGVAAAGAAAAALLTLRGSSGRNVGTAKKPIDISGSGDQGEGHPVTVKTAHQPDGTDSSKSFQAGIADENTVPGKS